MSIEQKSKWYGMRAKERCLPIWPVFKAPPRLITWSRIGFVAGLVVAVAAPWIIIDLIKELAK